MASDYDETQFEDGKPNTCVHCSESFLSKVLLQQHIKAVHKNQKSHPCGLCVETFTDTRMLRYHIKNVHNGEKGYKCQLCGKMFDFPSDVKSHVKKFHKGEKIHPCDLCFKKYTKLSDLKRHIASVHEGQKSECNLCGKQVKHLQKHLKSHEEQNKEKRECSYCFKEFSCVSSLNMHVKLFHEGMRDTKCEICPFLIARSGKPGIIIPSCI